jgi:hypothetical protein
MGVLPPPVQQAALSAVLVGVYGLHLPVVSEQSLLALLTTLLDLHCKRYAGDPSCLLRADSLFTHAFVGYCKEVSLYGNFFLIHALRNAVLGVLADDDLDLEVEPTLVWSRSGVILYSKLSIFRDQFHGRLSESKRVKFFGPNHGAIPLNTPLLLGNKAFRNHISRVYDRLLSACTGVVRGLSMALPSLPPVIRSVISYGYVICLFA